MMAARNHGRVSMARVCLLLLLVQFVCAAKQFCKCPRLLKPVCGTDGKTYPNACQAKCQNVGISNQGACLDCSKKVCPKSLCPDGSSRVRVDNNCCGCRKNPICPATKFLHKGTSNSWSKNQNWKNGIIPKKVDVAIVDGATKFASVLTGKGDVAMALRIKKNTVDVVIGRKGFQGSLVLGPDPKVNLCTGTSKCNMDSTALKKGFVGKYYGGLESVDSGGKIVSASARGIQISCLKSWQMVKGDKSKVYNCAMVNNLLDGFKPDTQCNQEKCPQTCQKKTCDEWTKQERYTCKELEQEYGCNCWGCKCRNLDEECREDKCLKRTCDDWGKNGYGCSQLEKNFKCGCSGCKCDADHNPTPPKNLKMLEGLSNIGGVEGKVTRDIGASGFNDAFQKSPKGIIYRSCPKCQESHKHIYYRRFTDYKKFKPYMYMACDWSSKNNIMNKDFKLYSTYKDAMADVGEWQYCNFVNFVGAKKNSLGGFRDCGPHKIQGGDWSVMVGAAKGKCLKGYHKGMQARYYILGVNSYNKCLGVTCANKGVCVKAGVCKDGKCTYTNKPDNTKCDDKNTNTMNDKCDKGVCVGTAKVDKCKGKSKCKAKGACFEVGKCNKGTGQCSNPPRKKGFKCTDGNKKTVDDQCDGNGVCKGIDKCKNVGCQAKDTCHVKGECNIQTGKCADPRKKTGAPCDDKDYKTVLDVCTAQGVCKGTNKCAKVKCSRLSQCHKIGICDFKTGKCSNPITAGAKCDDKKAKTTDDVCDSKAVCKGVDKCSGKLCKAKGACYSPGNCNVKTGLCSNPFAPKTLKCNDGDANTGDDKCNGSGVCKGRDLCAGSKKKCVAKGQCHLPGKCVSGTGLCSNPAKTKGTKCDDKNKNTENDKCDAKGVCTGTALKDECKDKPACKVKGQCYAKGVCQKGNGLCTNPFKAAKSKCDDKDKNTGDDQCDGKGNCKGRNLCVNVKCPVPSNTCTTLTCQPGTGKCTSSNMKEGTKCDDDNAVTVDDKCKLNNGKIGCKGIDKCASVKCKAKACYGTPKCDFKTGNCVLGKVQADGQACDDGNALTTKDKCAKGKCTGTKIKVCVILTGVGASSIGQVKGFVELYTTCDVPDLSLYGIGTANNGKGTDGKEFTFKSVKNTLPKGSFFYVSANAKNFKLFFGFDADFEYKLASMNGNDAVELFQGGVIVDTFGNPKQDGFKTKWEYTNGYGYRKDETGPDGGFAEKNWKFSGTQAFKGKKKNGGAKKYGGIFPVSTYCRKNPCIRLTTTTTTTTTTSTTGRETTTSTTTTSTSTTTRGGCTKKTACNYDPKAQGDNNSCKYPLKCKDCKGKCICKKDECGVCGGKGAGSDMKACAGRKGVQVNWIKDKTCDDVHNICVCGWDGGDCCGEKNEYKYCKKCKCQDPKFKKVEKQGPCGKCSGKCGKPVFKGDKHCDDNNNNCACNWDGGDCCGNKNNYNYCDKKKGCKCLDCEYKPDGDTCVKEKKKKCGNLKWKGDKNCDDINNNAGCAWDGGDCCGEKNKYTYCKKCECLDCTKTTKGDKCVKTAKKSCGGKDYVGDKYCDDNNNNAGCNWDKGDCCGIKNNYKYCKECKCRDCTYVSKGDKCVKSIKKGCGSPNWKGDGNCDDNNNNAGCNWDKGDCCGAKNYAYCKKCKCLDCTYVVAGDTCVKDFKKKCGAPKFKGDGYCDDGNNVGGCAWDGGDCCGDKANIKYCKECECKDCTKKKAKKCPGKAKGCALPNYKDDKNCDDENNNCRCSWDGGDCCAKTNSGSVNKKYCKACKCLDPENKSDPNCKGSCKFADYKGDGNCDDENNNCGCAYDGGDCCAKSLKKDVNKKYCKVCKCLDPKNKGDPNCKGGCGLANYKGDGNCDDENNNCGCGYDGGDCCAKSLKKPVNKKYCKVCKCVDPKNQADDNCKGTCGLANYKGDGNCDDENNNCGCKYDGGDCCKKTNKDGKDVNKKYCKKCLCIDPAGCDKTKNKCGLPNYKGDGNCDDENNNCGCAYDGGDCCKKTNKDGKDVVKKYCKKCECSDPLGK